MSRSKVYEISSKTALEVITARTSEHSVAACLLAIVRCILIWLLPHAHWVWRIPLTSFDAAAENTPECALNAAHLKLSVDQNETRTGTVRVPISCRANSHKFLVHKAVWSLSQTTFARIILAPRYSQLKLGLAEPTLVQ